MEAPLNLLQTAELIDGHVRVERELFRVTGFWSTDPTPSDRGAGAVAGAQSLFAAESAHHGWRSEQWDQRRVRSLESDGENRQSRPDWRPLVEATAEALHDELPAVSRLAVWGHVLAPWLAARYVAHRNRLAPAADGGLDRWLGICIEDLQRGGTEAVARLGVNLEPAAAEQAAGAVRSALQRVLAG